MTDIRPEVLPSREPTGELRRSFSLRGLAAVGGLFSTLLTTIVAVRSLDPRDATTLLAILAALMLGPMLGRLGLGQNVMRTLSAELDPAAGRLLAGAHVRTALLSSAICAPFVALAATAGLIGRPEFLAATVITACLIVLESVRLMLSDVFAANGQVRSAVLTTHHVRSIVVLPGLLLVAFVVGRPTLLQMLLVYLVVGVLLLLAVAVPAHRCVQLIGRAARGSLRGVIVSGITLLIVDAALFVVGRGDVWLAAATFAPVDAAHYSTASTLAFQVVLVEGLASLALTPIAARMWALGQREALLRLLSAVATLAFTFTAASVVLLALVGGLVLQIAYGPTFIDAYGVLIVLAAGGAGKAAFGLNVTLLIAMGELRAGARNALIALAVTIPPAVAAAVFLGPLGLAFAVALAAVTMTSGQWLAARRALPPGPGPGAPRPRPGLAQAWREVRRTRTDIVGSR